MATSNLRNNQRHATPLVAEPIADAVVVEKGNTASAMAILARAMSSGHSYKYAQGVSEEASRLIQKYQAICTRIDQLSSSPARKAGAEAQLARAKAKIAELENGLRNTKMTQTNLEARIQRNANPHFLHYLQIDREGKVRRLQQELADVLAKSLRLEADLKEVQQEVATIRSSLSSLQHQEAELRAANLDKQGIRSQIVQLSPNAEHVQLLKAQQVAIEGSVANDTQLLQQLNAVMSQVNNARQLFNQAHVALDRAQRDNFRAEREAEFDTWANWGDADYVEVGLQRDRDRMINTAKRFAFDAGNMLQAAFDAFPMEARVRFPEITRNVCNAPIPRLEGANFGNALNTDFWGGAYGALGNDFRAERKIDRDLYILRFSENLAAEQAAAVGAVLAGIDADVRHLKANLSVLTANIEKQQEEAVEIVRQSCQQTNYRPQSHLEERATLTAQAAF